MKLLRHLVPRWFRRVLGPRSLHCKVISHHVCSTQVFEKFIYCFAYEKWVFKVFKEKLEHNEKYEEELIKAHHLKETAVNILILIDKFSEQRTLFVHQLPS